MRKSKFVYEPENDGYRCPQGLLLAYATTDRNGYKHYRSDPKICKICQLLASCITTPRRNGSSPGMSGRKPVTAPTPTARRPGARRSTND